MHQTYVEILPSLSYRVMWVIGLEVCLIDFIGILAFLNQSEGNSCSSEGMILLYFFSVGILLSDEPIS